MDAPNANGASTAGGMHNDDSKRKRAPSTLNALVDYECGNLFVKKQRSDVDIAMQALGGTLPSYAQCQAGSSATRIDSGVSQSLNVHSPQLPSMTTAEQARNNASENKARLEPGEQNCNGVRVILRARGLPDFQLMANSHNTVKQLLDAFRLASNVPTYNSLTVIFGGKELKPETLIGNSYVYDMAIIEVRMGGHATSLQFLPAPTEPHPVSARSRAIALQMGTQADPIALEDSPPAKRIRQIQHGPVLNPAIEALATADQRTNKMHTDPTPIAASAPTAVQFYAVARGLIPGIYLLSEKPDVKLCTNGWKGAKVRPFATQDEAFAYVHDRKVDDAAHHAAVRAFFGVWSFATKKDWSRHKQLYKWFQARSKAKALQWARGVPAPTDTPYIVEQEEDGKAPGAELHHPSYNQTQQLAPGLSAPKHEPRNPSNTSSKYFNNSSPVIPTVNRNPSRPSTRTPHEAVRPPMPKASSTAEEFRQSQFLAEPSKHESRPFQPSEPSVAAQASHVHAVNSISAQFATDTILEPALCSEQRNLVDLILQGRNVFYTGSAGCGKSTVLKAFVRELKDIGRNVRIVAPTGKAALEVNGTTYFTFAGWTPSHFKKPLKDLVKGAHQRFVQKRMREVDVLIIDEVSMLENHIFERLNEVMKEARGNPTEAFGGVQIVVTGDFCQLPPVKPFQYCMTCGREMKHRLYDQTHTCPNHGTFSETDKWAFKSMAWRECNFTHVNLTTIHRQRDRAFIDILERCRMGKQLTDKEMNLLLNHECDVQNPTRLYSTRAEVARLNDAEFSKLKSKPRKFKCFDDAVIHPHHPNLAFKGEKAPDGTIPALREGKFESQVDIKDNMRVVLQVNLSIDQGLVNGAQGVVVDWEPYDKDKLPKAEKKEGRAAPRDKEAAAAMMFSPNTIHGEHADYREKRLNDFVKAHRIKEWPIVEFDGGLRRTIYAECLVYEFGDEPPYSIMSRTQIPLIAGWAMTVHKSQGMTLNKVEVDLGKAFEEGQVYVALSRATSLQGLKVLSLGQRVGNGNAEVHEFLRTKLGVKI